MRVHVAAGLGRGVGSFVRAMGLVATVSLLGIACGGRAIDDSGDGVPDVGGNGTQAGAGGKSPKGTVLDGKTPLPPCVRGVEQWRSDVCEYFAEGLCYATKLEACACVCPRDSQSSTCLSSFDVPSQVRCF